MNSWVCKLLIASILLCTVTVTANLIDIAKQYSESGQGFIRLINNTEYTVYCTIIGVDSRYFKDFYINPYKYGRWYIEPLGHYTWECR